VRLLLTCRPWYSHLQPLLPIARAARSQGHDLAVVTDSSLGAELSRHGLQHLPIQYYPPAAKPRDPERNARAFSALLRLGVRPDYERETIAPAVQVARALLPIIDSWRPDIVIHESWEYGAYLAAEARDLPHATVASGECCFLDGPRMLSLINGARADLDLAPVDDPHHALCGRLISYLPRSWDTEHLSGANVRCYRYPDAGQAGSLPPALTAIPSDRPFVYASLGSSDWMWRAPTFAAVFRAVVEAIGALDCQAVVAGGPLQEGGSWDGPSPPNVVFMPFAPQRSLLASCDLFVTYAGFSSTRESLLAGVPTVSLPLMGDQVVHASRLAEVGAGICLDRTTVSASSLLDACRTVLDSPSYARSARRMQQLMFALPSADEVVPDLQGLLS
jgi:UDP:flavonoid glycosyltransferase YjiC (YdhE family)